MPPSKRASKGRKAAILSDDDDRASQASLDSDASFFSGATGDAFDGDEATGGGSAARNDFQEALEKLGEKRTSTRESGLREMIAGMRAYTVVEELEQNRETAVAALLNLLKRAGDAEGSLAAEALGLLLLILGPGEDEIFDQVFPPLEVVVTRSKHEAYRIQAVQALALGCFICSTEEETMKQVLCFLEDVFRGESEGFRVPDELKAAAIDGWMLLATTAPPRYMTHTLRSRLLPMFLLLLDSPCAELKLAAGEAIAVLNEHWVSKEGFEYPEEEAMVLDAILDKLQELAREGSKKMSRRDKKAQRKSFREIEASVLENEPPEEVMSFRNRSFRLTSWAKIVQVEALRDALQGGFLSHFSANPVVHDILEIEEGLFDRELERNVVSKTSELSKLRTCARTRNRSFRLTSWAKIVQIEALRDALQGGFLSHFSANPVVHDILEIEEGLFDRELERNVVSKTSELSKLRTCARTRNRRSRENAKQHFFEGDEG